MNEELKQKIKSSPPLSPVTQTPWWLKCVRKKEIEKRYLIQISNHTKESEEITKQRKRKESEMSYEEIREFQLLAEKNERKEEDLGT